jgi:hypothetical protein
MYEPIYATIREYGTADVEATAALYHADAGWDYTPAYSA